MKRPSMQRAFVVWTFYRHLTTVIADF